MRYVVHVVHTYFAAGDFAVDVEDEDTALFEAKILAEGTLTDPELVEVDASVTDDPEATPINEEEGERR